MWLGGASGRRSWAPGEDKEGVCRDGLRCALRSELVGGVGEWSWVGMGWWGACAKEVKEGLQLGPLGDRQFRNPFI